MTNEIYTALEGFGTTLTTAINPIDILKVLGICLSAAAVIFFTMWGVRKLVKVMRSALKGRLSI